MTPAAAYKRFNRLLWANRLPKATITFVTDATLPSCYGITLQDDVCVQPVILLNEKYPWGKTLIHEMIHVAEPLLPHGKTFTNLVEFHWRIARTHLKRRKRT